MHSHRGRDWRRGRFEMREGRDREGDIDEKRSKGRVQMRERLRERD